MQKLRVILLFVAALFAATSAWADPSFPPLTAPIVDAANVLDATARTVIENRLRDYETSSHHQVAVATVPSLEGYDIRDYGNRLFRFWALGDKQRNDGVLVLVAPTEHKVSIEVGYGLEGDLTDAMSRLIIENAMVPRFKAGDYVGGIHAGLDDIEKVVGGQGSQVVERVQNQSVTNNSISDNLPFIIIFLVVGFILIRASGGRAIIIPGGGFSSGGFGGGGGGFSGGGGWSGGGGSSGGGGASGGW